MLCLQKAFIMRFIDLSVAIENDLPVDRPENGPKIRYQSHQETFADLAKSFAGLRRPDLPDGEAWASPRRSRLAMTVRQNVP